MSAITWRRLCAGEEGYGEPLDFDTHELAYSMTFAGGMEDVSSRRLGELLNGTPPLESVFATIGVDLNQFRGDR